MAVQKLTLSFTLAWFLLAGLFLIGEATVSRCKQRQVRERKPTYETLHWQEACLPLAVIVGGCCGLVWWVLLIIYDVSQTGGQKGLPQISGEEELEEQKIRAPGQDHLEEWTDTEIKVDSKAASKGLEDVSPKVEIGPSPPSQPKEQGSTTFWAYMEQELERILLAIRRHQTTKEIPAAEDQKSTLTVERPSPCPSPKPIMGDWQSFLAYVKQYPLPTEGQSPPAVDKQYPPPGEGPSSQAMDQQSPKLPKEGQSPPAEDKQSPPSGEMQSSMQSSPAEERKKSPNRKTRSRSKGKKKSPNRKTRSRSKGRKKSPNRKTRSRSKRKSRASPSSRSRGCSSCCKRPCSKHR